LLSLLSSLSSLSSLSADCCSNQPGPVRGRRCHQPCIPPPQKAVHLCVGYKYCSQGNGCLRHNHPGILSKDNSGACYQATRVPVIIQLSWLSLSSLWSWRCTHLLTTRNRHCTMKHRARSSHMMLRHARHTSLPDKLVLFQALCTRRANYRI